MKRHALVFASFAIAISCTANPPILPEPNNATTGTGGFGGDGGAGGDSSSSVTTSGSSSGTPLPGDGSGTRLKRYQYTSDDGLQSEYPHRLFDSVSQKDCVPVRTSVGTFCVTGINGAFQSQYYSDSACTTHLAYGRSGCAAPLRLAIAVPGVCALDAISKVVQLSPYTAATMYSKAPGCLEVPAVVPNEYEFYQLGPEVDYTQFAAMTLEHE